jgi:hypothetical protein
MGSINGKYMIFVHRHLINVFFELKLIIVIKTNLKSFSAVKKIKLLKIIKKFQI